MSVARPRFWSPVTVAGAVVLGVMAVLAIGWIVGSSSGQGRDEGAASTLRTLLQALAAQVEIDPAEGLRLRALPSDPRFSPHGRELYWEVEGPSGERLRSNSLGEKAFLLAPRSEQTEMRVRAMMEPTGRELVLLEERVRLGESTVRIAVGLERRTVALGGPPSQVVLAVALAALGFTVVGLLVALSVTRHSRGRL